jgi:hypothetical protein
MITFRRITFLSTQFSVTPQASQGDANPMNNSAGSKEKSAGKNETGMHDFQDGPFLLKICT